MSGNGPEARRLLEQLKAESARRYVSPVLPAMIHAALGEKTTAPSRCWSRPTPPRTPLLIPIQVGEVGGRFSTSPEERLAALRADPRFGDLFGGWASSTLNKVAPLADPACAGAS